MASIWRWLTRKDGELVSPFAEAKPPFTWKALVRRYNIGISTYLKLPGITGNYASTPDTAALDIVGDIDLRAAVALNDWTPAAGHDLVRKYLGTGNQRSYILSINTDGTIWITWTTLGVTAISMNSTAAPTVANGALLLVRATLDVNDGAGNRVAKFYTKTSTLDIASADLRLHTGWTQLGDTVTTAGTTSIFASTTALGIGAAGDGSSASLVGKAYAAAIYDGIEGTEVFAVDFTKGPVGAGSIIEDANAAVVTINKTGTTPAAIVDGAT